MNISNKELESLQGKNLISITDLNAEQILSLLDLALKIKNKEVNFDLPRKVLGLIFEKSSTRTRVSFQVAMNNINGTTIEINPGTSQIGRGEPIKDTARVLSKYVDALAIRTFNQNILEEYVRWSDIPIINALTDLEHPCQILADFLTIKEEFGKLEDIIISYIGDPNNVSNSLILGSAMLGIKVNIGCPEKIKPDQDILEKANLLSRKKNIIKVYNDPEKAVLGSNVIYTDVWASMGQESQALEKEDLFAGFTVNKKLVKLASDNHIILHCLPAYRDKEITEEIIDSKSSRIFKQAENRLHVQEALLSVIFS